MFYVILDKLCKEKGTTITAVLKELNISTSKGTAWKNGSIPNADVLLTLSRYFRVSMEYLMGAAEADKSGEIEQISPGALEILLKLTSLSDEQLQEVKRYIDYQSHQANHQ